VASGAALTTGVGLWWLLSGSDADVLQAGAVDLPGGELYPAKLHHNFAVIDRDLTREAEAARYCNFYEFSITKEVWRYIKPFQPHPWTIEVGGLVHRPRTFGFEELLRMFPLEERIYRHRCVEAWAMAVPWTGFPLASLVKAVEPMMSAKYVRFESFDRPEQASRMQNRNQPWPYTEGLTIVEATNELAFLATGIYGHALPKQHGSPIRLVVPWKYGFKSAKSLVKIEFTETRPATFWNTVQPQEYDFEANVNPDVPHPRWSQRSERMLGSGERRETQIYNGYGEWVAGLY
jgi:sulfoxide reductase catalytic subunit YedY